MRSLLITTAVVTVAIMLTGCREKKSQPVPGPQSGSVQRTTAAASVRGEVSRESHPLFRY